MKKISLVVVLIMQLCASGLAQRRFPQQRPAPLPDRSQKPATSPDRPQKPAPQDDDDVVRITTNLVQVDAVVTDKNGKPVTDLLPEEVEIHENGKPQQITSFSYVSLDSGDPATASAPVKPAVPASPIPPVRLRPEQVRRTMALLVDDLGLSFESVFSVRRALKKFVDEQLQPNDLVAIVRTTGGVGSLQAFTSDKRQLYAAIEKVRWYPLGRGKMQTFAPIEGIPPAAPFGGPPNLPKDEDPSAKPKEDLEEFRNERITDGTLGMVNHVVRGLRDLPGRKSVVLITDGFKICKGLSETYATSCKQMVDLMRTITDAANRASVVIYTMDARGLEPLGFTAADNTSGRTTIENEEEAKSRRQEFGETQDGPDFLARETGGIAFRNSNDLAGGIKRFVADQKGYYVIGYRPDEATFEKVGGRRKFHDLGLKVTRSGKFNVRMRSGFFGITDEERVPVGLTPISEMQAALNSPFGASGVHVRLTSLFANDPKQGSFMRSCFISGVVT
ncbi:MAG TPA: VWA domain-containing protein [Pyrinomonadaceae bacterium]|nr:VWA domain-containing protein [Pyrinomonadaceae bacterium]